VTVIVEKMVLMVRRIGIGGIDRLYTVLISPRRQHGPITSDP
jgi:hypothetical protein